MKKRLKINGIIMLVAFILIAVFPCVFFRSTALGIIETITQVLGIAFILMGQIIRVSARGYKAENSQNSQALIQGGPYQIVRNPMYLGIFLIGMGVVLSLFNWWAITIFFAIFAIRYLLLIRQEERKLQNMFPGVYDVYCKKVPRIIPALSSLVAIDFSAYLPIRLSWFKKEMGSIVALLCAVILIEFWQDVAHQGIKFYLKESVWLFGTIVLFIIFVILLNRWTKENDRPNKS